MGKKNSTKAKKRGYRWTTGKPTNKDRRRQETSSIKQGELGGRGYWERGGRLEGKKKRLKTALKKTEKKKRVAREG